MSDLAIFLAEITASLLVSGLVVLRLQGLLRRIGSEACPSGGGSTEFWITYVQLMMFIAPLILVSFVSRADGASHLSLVAQLKGSLLIVLSGQFVGLVIVGRAVWKSLVAPAAKASPLPAGGAS